jgi:hypothetical protein
MGLHFWLLPFIAIVAAGIGAFFLVISRQGGSGIRNEGRTLFDKPVHEVERKANWNYYGKP